MLNSFTFGLRLPRVVFGAGALQYLGREVDAIGSRQVLVLSTPEQVADGERVAGLLGARAAGVFAQAAMHVPRELVGRALAEVSRVGADCVVAIGGGSTTGLAKAIALESSLPIVAIPTTYAGSEMTSIYGVTDASVKITGRDVRVLPSTAIYDPELSLNLPMRMTVSSGLNAIAHAAESLYAHDGNPVVSLMAEEGIRAIVVALEQLREAPGDLAARTEALYGAWLCGAVLGAASMGLHHKLCHTLGGTFNLPHAELHAVVLPHAMSYNAVGAPQAMERIARALRVTHAPAGLFDLLESNGLPVSLKTLGMPRDGIEFAADLAVKNPYPNPQPLEKGAIRLLLERAYEGVRPE